MAYFLTFTTYGTHLPGDARGSLDRRGALLEVSPALETFASNLMPEGPLRLERAEDRRTVREAIVEVCRHRDWHLVAGTWSPCMSDRSTCTAWSRPRALAGAE